MDKDYPEVPNQKKSVTTKKKKRKPKKADHKHDYETYYYPFNDWLGKHEIEDLENDRRMFVNRVRTCKICGKQDEDFAVISADTFRKFGRYHRPN